MPKSRPWGCSCLEREVANPSSWTLRRAIMESVPPAARIYRERFSPLAHLAVRGSAAIRPESKENRTYHRPLRCRPAHDHDGAPPGSRTVNTEPLPCSLATMMSPPIMRASTVFLLGAVSLSPRCCRYSRTLARACVVRLERILEHGRARHRDAKPHRQHAAAANGGHLAP
jgi:hypothetical protein